MNIIESSEFSKNVKKYKKDKVLMERLKAQIRKITQNPETAGEFLIGNKRGEKKLYIPPFRLIFIYKRDDDTLYLLDFDKRDIIYRK